MKNQKNNEEHKEHKESAKEYTENNSVEARCPNMLIEKDGEIVLFNSNLAVVPGVNPIKFKSLEEYAEFVQWQESQNIKCPVVYLQYSTDTQNNDLILVKPSIFETNGGIPFEPPASLLNKNKQYYEDNKILDATLDSTPSETFKFNTGMYSGFDEQNQDIGNDTPLDRIYHESNSDGKSRNPHDPNWGGKDYTALAVEQGDYKDREVYKYT